MKGKESKLNRYTLWCKNQYLNNFTYYLIIFPLEKITLPKSFQNSKKTNGVFFFLCLSWVDFAFNSISILKFPALKVAQPATEMSKQMTKNFQTYCRLLFFISYQINVLICGEWVGNLCISNDCSTVWDHLSLSKEASKSHLGEEASSTPLYSLPDQLLPPPQTQSNLSTCLNIKPYSDQLRLHLQMCTHFHMCYSKIFEWKTSLYWLVSITLNYSKYFNTGIKWYKLFLSDGCINTYIFLW